ncbi:retrovirus-related pol polyprotein from transposon TNT 1-94, partial [Tanacetum coccineum]
NDDFLPYVPTFDPLSTNNITIPVTVISITQNINPSDELPDLSFDDDHHKPDHFDLAETHINDIPEEQYITINDGYRQEEGIDYDEMFAPVARLEAIKIFLAYAAYMGFMVYQIDVKSGFLNGKLSKEVYVKKPHGFESSEFPNYVCKLDKALYGLKQARKAWSLKGTSNIGLWYPKGPGFDLKAYLDSDYAGLAISSAEAEYVAVVGCYAQVLWIKNQLADYDILYDKVPIFCDNISAIAISNNLVLHLRTKHIDIRYHFIRDNLLSKNYKALPQKETIRAGLATLGSVDKKKPHLTSFELINSSPLRIRYFSSI